MLNAWLKENSTIDGLIDINALVNDGNGGTRSEYLQKDHLHLTLPAQKEIMLEYASKLDLSKNGLTGTKSKKHDIAEVLDGIFNMKYSEGKIVIEIDDTYRPKLILNVSKPIKTSLTINMQDAIAKRQFFGLFSKLYEEADGLDQQNNSDYMNNTVPKLFKYYEEEFRSQGVKIPKYESMVNAPKAKSKKVDKSRRFYIFYEGQFLEKLKSSAIEFKEFEDFDFFIHRSYDKSEAKAPVHDGTSWVISEGRSGTRIIAPQITRQAAIDEAIKKLKEITPEKLSEVIEKNNKVNGISPRYSGSNAPVKNNFNQAKAKALALEIELELLAA
jgi:hypothetical protein